MAKVPEIFSVETFGGAAEGFLFSTQTAANLPFPVKRVFWLKQVPATYTRGLHAHYTTEEILIALHGTVTISTETRAGKEIFSLASPEKALYLPPQCWVTLNFSPDSLLLCLTSTDFDPADYIRDYETFRQLISPSK